MHTGNLRGTELTPGRAGGRERLTATANGERLVANGNGLRERFDAFWAVYPRRIGKDAAWRAWQKRRPSPELTHDILAAVEQQRQWPDWQKDGGQYIPHPSTWLNQGRWQDEGTAATQRPLVSDRTRENIANQSEALKLIEGGAYGPQRQR